MRFDSVEKIEEELDELLDDLNDRQTPLSFKSKCSKECWLQVVDTKITTM